MLNGLEDLLPAAIAWASSPWMLAVLLLLSTFVLEDAAILAGTALATQGALPVELAFAALAIGIALGDMGLYGLGRLAGRLAWVRRVLDGDRGRRAETFLRLRMIPAVLFSRVVPGLRMPTYVAAGAMRLDLALFALLVALGTLVWTGLLFGLGVTAGGALGEALGIPPALAAGAVLLTLVLLLPPLLRRLPLAVRTVPERKSP